MTVGIYNEGTFLNLFVLAYTWFKLNTSKVSTFELYLHVVSN